MKNRQRDVLARRQQQLLLRSAELRVALAHQARALQTPLDLADQARNSVQWLRQHPLWPLLSLALLAFKRPQGVLRWGSSLMGGWGLYLRLRAWLDGAQAKPSSN